MNEHINTAAMANRVPANRVPVSVVTGYLGAGKTTLINHLVQCDGMEDTALIINEFGEVGLDHVLVEKSFENTLLLENGCVCCTIRGDLIDTISDLFAKVAMGDIPAFTRILVETTGIADPGPIAASVMTDEGVVHRCRMENIITLVDGVLGKSRITEDPIAAQQVAQADLVLLSKGDLCAGDELAALHSVVWGINPSVLIEETVQGVVDPDRLFATTGMERSVGGGTDHDHDHDHDHGHDHDPSHDHDPDAANNANGAFSHGDIATWSYVSEAALDEGRLRDWLDMMYSLRPRDMLRLKGYVYLVGEDRPLLLHGVGGVISPPRWLADWPQGGPETRLVMIFQGISPDAVRDSFLRHVVADAA